MKKDNKTAKKKNQKLFLLIVYLISRKNSKVKILYE
jgi:hypothetical protein